MKSASRYVLIWGCLLVLTGASYLAAQTHLGPWEPVVALTIASVKATLVALFFMHLLHSAPMTRLILVVTALWVLMLIGGILTDVVTRPG